MLFDRSCKPREIQVKNIQVEGLFRHTACIGVDNRAVWHPTLPLIPPLQSGVYLDRISGSSYCQGRAPALLCCLFVPVTSCESVKNRVEQKREGFGCTLCGCSSIRLAHKALRGFHFPTVHLGEDFSLYGKTLRRFIVMEKGFWLREELTPCGGTHAAETQHNHYTHGLSIMASPAVKSHILGTGPSFISRFWGVFIRKFSWGGGGNLTSFICLCVSQKHREGSWAGTCGALSSPTKGLVSQHPLGLVSPGRADDAEFLVRCTNSYPASCWP